MSSEGGEREGSERMTTSAFKHRRNNGASITPCVDLTMNTFLPSNESAPADVEQLEDLLSRPPAALVESMSRLDGDILFLGVGGKMGPTMARMASRALRQAGSRHQVLGVSRFRDRAVQLRLEQTGVRTIVADLLDAPQVQQLPLARYVVAMTGFKFGMSQQPELAWAANCYMPALICQRFHHSHIVAFSTGNVYGLTPRESGGSVETDPPNPVGEYAMTALGRERMYEYFSRLLGTPVVLLRLNYATELRYGVLVDLAQQIAAGEPVDLGMSYVNVIWLGDANAMALHAFSLASSPARIINLAGPELLSTRDIGQKLAQQMGRTVRFVAAQQEEALLNNGQLGHQLLGMPVVSADTLIRWTAEWMARGGSTLGKPTHFQNRAGQF